MNTKKMRVLSLFSGVGGFDMGLEAAGMTTAFQCEIDKHARSVLDYHWPDVPKWDDVTTLTGAYILEQTGGVDLVAWGSPCQDLSLAGKRAGLSGERSGLFHEGIRIIKELRELSNGQSPTWSIWENVYGALSSNRGADFGQVLYEMDEAGACFSEWAVLDAQYFGVPQRRRRVFVASCFDFGVSEQCGSPLFPVSESVSRYLAPRITQGEGVAGTVAESVGTGSQWAAGTNRDGVLTTSVTAKWHKGTGGPSGSEHYNLVVADAIPIHDQATRFSGKRLDKIDGKGNGLGIGNPGDPMNTLTKGDRHAIAYEEPLLIDGRRVDDVRVYTEPVQTLQERMGTGGNNVPVVAQEQEPIVFQPGTMIRLNGGVWEGGPAPTLRAYGKSGDNEPHVIQTQEQSIVIDRSAFNTGFDFDRDPGIEVTDTTPTLVARGQHAVGQETFVKSRRAQSATDHETWIVADVTPTLNVFDVGDTRTTTAVVSEPAAFDEYNNTVSNIHHALRAGTRQSTGVLEPSLIVRRLTPLECERLMGWPDNHTAIGTNGKISDTNRYKMCGNGIASPVAQWLAIHLMKEGL